MDCECECIAISYREYLQRMDLDVFVRFLYCLRLLDSMFSLFIAALPLQNSWIKYMPVMCVQLFEFNSQRDEHTIGHESLFYFFARKKVTHKKPIVNIYFFNVLHYYQDTLCLLI